MTSDVRIGIEPRADRVLVARVTVGETGFEEYSVELRATSAPLEVAATTPVAIAVPDHEVGVKSLSLPHSNSLDFLARVSFELSQSILEPPELFLFDALPTLIRDRFIGLIYRQERLRVLKLRLLAGQNGSAPEPRFLMRAVALGRGYDRFAESDSDGLLCLADLAGGAVSLCFLYQRTIIAVAHMAVGATESGDSRSTRAVGTDLKSLINYHLAGCAQHGLSVPLSAVVMCGGLAESAILDSVAPLSSARVVMPRLKTGSVRFDCSDESIRFSDCVAALGLTVN